MMARGLERRDTSSERNRINGIFKGRGRRRIPGAIAPDRLNGKGLPPHHPDACGLRTRIPGRTVLRAMMARSLERRDTSSERNRTNGIFKGRGRRRIPGAIAPDRLNGKGLPPHHPDACGLRTRIPGRTVLRATMARSPKAASFKRTDGKAVPLTA